MNVVQRYNYQKNDPIQRHVDDFVRIINHFGTQLFNSLNSRTIDSYIISMVRTRDGRRALLDVDDIDKAKAAIEKDIIQEVSKDINILTSQIQQNLK